MRILPTTRSKRKKERKEETNRKRFEEMVDRGGFGRSIETVKIQVSRFAVELEARLHTCRSMATAALHDHVFVLLQYNVAFVEEIQH